MKRVSTQQAGQMIDARTDFTTHGSLRGERVGMRTTIYTGGLPGDWADLYREHFRSGLLTYVVWSYVTPIAWEHDGTWYRPGVRYSATTSRHQGQCHRGIQDINEAKALTYA